MTDKPTRSRRRSRSTSSAYSPATAFQQWGSTTSRPQCAFLSESNRDRLAQRALDLLSGHGVAVVHPQAYEALKKAGAIPGTDTHRLRLPDAMVREALENTPAATTLCGKTPDKDLPIPRNDNGFIMRTGTGAHGFIEPATARYRNLDISDVPTIAAVANGLDEIGFIAHPFCYGVHELTSDIHGVASLIQHTNKHIWLQPYNLENVDYLLRIVAAAAGSESALKERPVASCIMCSFTPLEFKVMDVEALIQCGRYGIPVHACSLPSAGGTAPFSVGGNVLMAVAEILAMITLGHVLSPGLPIIATPLMFTLDMRTGRALHSSVESLQAKAAAVDVLKNHFNLMTHTYGAGSDTPDVDHQSMAERALLGQLVSMSGCDILGGVGQLECATVFSPVQAVLDNELGRIYRRLLVSPAIDDDALNWQEVSQIGVGEHFLDSRHTLRQCRAQLSSDIFQRIGRDDYEARERQGAFEAARDLALKLIDEADGPVLDQAQIDDINRLTEEADKDIIEKARSHTGAREVI